MKTPNITPRVAIVFSVLSIVAVLGSTYQPRWRLCHQGSTIICSTHPNCSMVTSDGGVTDCFGEDPGPCQYSDPDLTALCDYTMYHTTESTYSTVHDPEDVNECSGDCY